MACDKLQIQVCEGTLPGEKVMVLDGFLNAETAFRFADLVRQQKPAILVVDMTLVPSIDSSGLGVLIGIYVSFEKNTRRLLLAGVNDRILELFRTCKVEEVFARYASVRDAEQALTAAPVEAPVPLP
ncbi:MAG TPA: STAS domain-containing protein [Bryobacteraceae bacterium]|nr:STAS domain-containing protein [Bryobacteraceae bacterium]